MSEEDATDGSDPTDGTDPAGRLDRARARADLLKGRAHVRYVMLERQFPVITALTARMLTVGLMDAATRLAAQIFITTVPLLFALGAFAPESVRNTMTDSLRSIFGIHGAAAQQVQSVVHASGSAGELRQTTGIIGILMAVIAATSCSRALTRICNDSWRLRKASTRIAAWRWLAWIAAMVTLLVCQGPVRNGFGAGLWLGVPLTFVLSVAIWWWTQHLLLAKRVPWLPLLPGAVLCAISATGLSLTARIYMPNALNRALVQYGSLGLVLTCLSWLIVLSVALTFSIAAGAVLAQNAPLDRPLNTPADLAGPSRQKPAGG
ncbi:YhjD/YihY/BrkB family envelope integrity protein [Streptacidiphilus sp. MAP5-3]|uniref:YhjD/YihY/BrkB family envelope integrity protein n=1 Tax=unclassified Streptacidiphilus TaxID=2643834 RepID=UPI00351802D7